MAKEGMNCEKPIACMVSIQKVVVRDHEVGTSDDSLEYTVLVMPGAFSC